MRNQILTDIDSMRYPIQYPRKIEEFNFIRSIYNASEFRLLVKTIILTLIIYPGILVHLSANNY